MIVFCICYTFSFSVLTLFLLSSCVFLPVFFVVLLIVAFFDLISIGSILHFLYKIEFVVLKKIRRFSTFYNDSKEKYNNTFSLKFQSKKDFLFFFVPRCIFSKRLVEQWFHHLLHGTYTNVQSSINISRTTPFAARMGTTERLLCT